MPITVQCACGRTLEADEPQAAATCPACGKLISGATTAVQAAAPVPASTAVMAEMPTVHPKVSADTARPTLDIRIRPNWTPSLIALGAIAGVLAVVLACGVGGYFTTGALGGGGGQKAVAEAQVRGSLTWACEAYAARSGGRFPPNLETLTVPDAQGVIYLEMFEGIVDPWGQPYHYDVAGPRNHGRRPDIWAVAPDGTEIGNWSKMR